jgi:hypothetical protein
MKLFKLLVSVNFAAVLPIVVQSAGQATETAISDKADWIKDNLVALEKAKEPFKLRYQKPTLAKSETKLTDNALGLTTSKQLKQLRPFLANRRLPTERELERGLIAQTPRLAIDPSTPLNGKVATYYNGANYDSAYSSAAPARFASAAGQNQQISQLAHRFAKAAATTGSAIPQSQSDSQTSGSFNPNDYPSAQEINGHQSSVPPQLGFPLMRQAERHLNEQPQDTAAANADQAIIDQYAQMEFGGDDPSSGGANLSASSGSSAGPPPFPLNLLPQSSLKQLVRGMARPTRLNGPQPYFGCWHGGQGSTSRFTTPRNLPQAGFHSYIRGNGFPRYQSFALRSPVASRPNFNWHRTPAYHVAHRPYTGVVSTPLPAASKHYAPTRRPMFATRRLAPTVKVAVYPPYSSQVRLF